MMKISAILLFKVNSIRDWTDLFAVRGNVQQYDNLKWI